MEELSNPSVTSQRKTSCLQGLQVLMSTEIWSLMESRQRRHARDQPQNVWVAMGCVVEEDRPLLMWAWPLEDRVKLWV